MVAFKVLLGGFLVLICGVLCQTKDILEPKVKISQGTVVGSTTEDGFYEFYGIPYADSTSGANRFQAPSPPPTFRNEFLSNRKNVKCIKAAGTGYEGTEDCLVVDIITPTLDRMRRLPVMVWIKGTEFDARTDLDQSLRFMQKDVVIVRLNYRESILGFLCLGTKSAPGNAGLKDIIAGLKLIQKEVSVFGGDPNNIILVGHGSGAAAVDLISLSPLAEGLVHKVISQSGNALSPWAVTRDNLRYAIQVAEALGHTETSIDSIGTLADILSRASTAALMAAINVLELTDNSLAFAPCIEKEIENEEAFMLKSPYEIIKAGEQMKIPFMTGFVDFEGTIRANEAVNDDWLERMQNQFVKFLQSDLDFPSNEEKEKTSEEIRSFYFGNGTIDETQVNNFLKYNGDTMILVSAIREARLRAETSSSPVYLYQFSYRGKRSEEVLSRPLQVERAGHTEELVYMFSNEDDLTDLDLTIGDILIERWTNFAKTGEPTSETSKVTWLPYYNSTQNNYLKIIGLQELVESGNSDLDVNSRDPHPDILAFWDSIYFEHFADAQSFFRLEDRTSTSDNPSTQEGFNGTTTTPAPDSASTAVGYTFVIISLFAVLDKIHTTQLLS